jgi:hypothetical protein
MLVFKATALPACKVYKKTKKKQNRNRKRGLTDKKTDKKLYVFDLPTQQRRISQL